MSALVHSLLSFKTTIKSQASTGIGSVGISEDPILPMTSLTSGKFSFKTLADFIADSTVCERLLPVNVLISTAKSPSSSVGINSAPKKVKIILLMINKPMAIATTNLFEVNAKFNIGV